MKQSFLSILLSCGLLTGGLPTMAQNIIPRPANYTGGEGQFVFATGTEVACEALPDSLKTEALRFVAAFETASGIDLTTTTATTSGVNCVQSTDNTYGAEGYRLSVTPAGVTVEAGTAAGFYYAFQSLKMLLPRNVMAEKTDAAVTDYAATACTITDAPRFGYRGFMLDCSRHFFAVDEIKRILDIMGYYKLNRFHWHLTDDQGWRFEMPAYPRLQTVAATRQGSHNVDPVYGRYFVADEYGPYYYTQDEMRDIVAYAAERHIEVIPEIEMPGHLCAVVTAYPEFSCNPYGAHRVWNDGGISTDVLDISNPKAIQFCKDVLDELVKIFPSKYIHIGGDECPTTAWENSASCQALKEELGYTNMRGLQSHFTHELAQYMANKANPAERRKLIAWNESVTAGGSDTELLKDDDLTIMCWVGAENASNVAENLGMQTIITPQPAWYINRKQSPRANEVHNAGGGTDATLQVVYNHKPTIRSRTLGIQGTFWCEHVSNNWVLEYQALPRLIAIAEVGWTPDNLRDFDNFLTRLRVDTTLLNYGDYAWCDYLVSDASDSKVMPEPDEYYRLVVQCTDARAGRCIELVAEGSPLVSASATQATVGRLWSNTPITDANDPYYNYQFWTFVEDPENPGVYAMVCKAAPEGSVNPSPTQTSTAGRWNYDTSTRHYNFVLGEGTYYGELGDGTYYYSIRSNQITGYYLNSSLAGQRMAINVYGNPVDGNSGLFAFQPENAAPVTEDSVAYKSITDGKIYRIESTGTPEWTGLRLSDNGKNTLGHSTSPWCNDAWRVTATESVDGVQTITLTNAATGRAVSSASAPVELGSQAVNLTLTYNAATDGYTIGASGALFIPIGDGYAINPGTVSPTTNALVPQGSCWQFTEVATVTYTARDESGALIGTYTASAALGQPYTPVAPAISGYECLTDASSLAGTESVTDNLSYELTYRRTGYAVTLSSHTAEGVLIAATTESVALADAAAYAWTAPTLSWYTYESATASSPLTLGSDTTIALTYGSDAVLSFAERLDEVTALEDGKYYLIYNNDVRGGGRNGYLHINPETGQVTASYTVSGSPYYVWKAEQSGNGFKLRAADGRYIPELPRSAAVYVADEGATFSFTYDGTDWAIGNGAGRYFDGNSDGSFTGWDTQTPVSYKVFTFRTEPYYALTYVCQTAEGDAVGRGSYTYFYPAGSAYTLECPVSAPSGYPYVMCSEAEESGNLTQNLTVTYTFGSTPTGIASVTTGASNAASQAWYDLSGRRLSKAPTQPGIYIHGGKKVYVK